MVTCEKTFLRSTVGESAPPPRPRAFSVPAEGSVIGAASPEGRWHRELPAIPLVRICGTDKPGRSGDHMHSRLLLGTILVLAYRLEAAKLP